MAGEANAKVQLANAIGFSPKERITLHQKQPDMFVNLLEPVDIDYQDRRGRRLACRCHDLFFQDGVKGAQIQQAGQFVGL